MGKIFCFIGKSSSGKDTIFRLVSNEFNDVKEIVPFTTRPIREGETEGKEYHFVTHEEFERMVNDGEVIESRSYNTHHGLWTYFTAVRNIDLDNNDYMLINTLEGYNSLKDYYGYDMVVPIYVEVKDDGERLMRALKREMRQDKPKYEEMCRRFLEDQKDFSEEKIATSGISKRFINSDLSTCVLQIIVEMHRYLEKEKQYRI